MGLVTVVPDTAGPNTPADLAADPTTKFRVFIRPVTGDESEILDGGGYTITP